MVPAGRAGAAVDEGTAVALGSRPAQVEAEAGVRIGNESRAVAGEAGGDRAVEDIQAKRDAGQQVVDLANAQQVLWGLLRQQRRGQRQHAAHLVLVAAERAADREAVDGSLGYRLRRFPAQILVDAALHDPEYGLSRRALRAVPLQAAPKPAVGALHRARCVVPIRVIGRALVEDQGDVGSELRLHLHRDLGREEQRAAIPVGAEMDSLLGDRDHRSVAPSRPTAPLHLVGHSPVRQREDLESTRIRDQRPVPPHEPMQPAGGGDPVRARRDEQVVRIAKHHLVPQLRHLGRLQPPHRPLRGQRDERRRPDRPVRGVQHARPGCAVAGLDIEPQPSGSTLIGRIRH